MVDEFRLDDLANEDTRVHTRRSGSAKPAGDEAPADDEKTDAATSSARSPKDKM
jgi:hypothetical protein